MQIRCTDIFLPTEGDNKFFFNKSAVISKHYKFNNY